MEQFIVKDLTFSYPEAEGNALNDINISIEAGQYIAICGKSGSGKTTLMRHLKTVLTPYGSKTGDVLYCGEELSKVSGFEQSSKIGYVMQDPESQIVTDKVWHELAFGLESLGYPQSTMRLKVAEMASYFGIADWFEKDVSTLSGGQKQLLNLASIMAMQPEVLILDEPTSQLDPIAAADFLNTVRKINLELGTTVIISEHRLEDIVPCADRVIVMEDGKVIADDLPQRIGEKLLKSDMFFALPAPMRIFYESKAEGRCPLTVREGRKWIDETVKKYKELELGDRFQIPEHPAVELKEIWFRYEREGRDVLKGVNMRFPKGAISAVLGGNGTGKSTMLKTICGICRPYRGKIIIDGTRIKDRNYSEKIAMLPQDPKYLFVKKTVSEELLEMVSDKDDKIIEDVIKICELSGLLNSHPYDLSGGEQQRVALAKILSLRPSILLLDEPTKGIDNFFKSELAQILKKLTSNGNTVIMVSHDIEFCAKYADNVSMFFNGSIVTTETPRRFFSGNSFYTTAANRMSRHILGNAVTDEDVINVLKENK